MRRLITADFSELEIRVLAMQKRPKNAEEPKDRVRRLMTRLEQTVPFPMNVEEFYSSLFPPGFVDMVMTHEVTVPLHNMRNVTPRGNSATVMIAPDKFIRCEFAGLMPIPHATNNTTSSGLIICNKDHPAIGKVLEWYSAAMSYDTLIGGAESAMTQALESVASPAWQELHRAIRTKPGHATLRARRRLSEIVSDDDKKVYDDMLAAAVLLPETKLPHAWVGLLGR